MSLKDFNLEVVTINGKCMGLRPTIDCTIDGKKYIYKTDKEDSYMPIDELKVGCVMNTRWPEKSLILHVRYLFSELYVEIWDVPYKDYSKAEITHIIKTKRSTKSISMK